MGVKIDLSLKERTQTESVQEQGAEENTCDKVGDVPESWKKAPSSGAS
jgi:hypothetical protein